MRTAIIAGMTLIAAAGLIAAKIMESRVAATASTTH